MEILPSNNRGNAPHVRQTRSESCNSIQVHHEVTVVSSTDSFGTRNANYRSDSRTAPPVATHIRRPSSSRTYSSKNVDDPRPMSRYSSDNPSSRNPRYGMDPTVPSQMAKEGAMADSNREGMRALAEFLTSMPPPPTNMMARASDDDVKSVKSMKRRAFGIFGKMGKKKEKPEKLIRLPDSAVSCQTDTGARYIAITIPMEHDNLGLSHQSSTRDSREFRDGEFQPTGRTERTPMSLLDPVVEILESSSFPMLKSSSRTGTSDRADHERARSEANGTPAAEIIGPEAAKTLENFYRQQNRDSRPDRVPSIKSEKSWNSSSYVGFPTIAHQESRHELRNLSAAAESTATPDHSRGLSSVSTAPSLRTVITPPRSSSLSRISPELQQELAEISTQQAEEAQKVLDRNLTAILSNETMQTSASIYPPTVISTVKKAQGYGGGLVGVGQTPKPQSPAPGTIIDISGARALVISRPATAPPSQARPIKTDILKRHSATGQSNLLAVKALANVGEYSDVELTESPPESRQERVKTRKSRDMVPRNTENTKHRRKSAPGVYDYLRSGVDLTTFNPRDFNKENGTHASSKSNRVKRLSSIASPDSGNIPQGHKEVAEHRILESRMNRQNMMAPLAMNPVTPRDQVEERELENLGSQDEIEDFIEATIQPPPRVPERSLSRSRNANISINSTSTARFLMDRVGEKEFGNIGSGYGDVQPTAPLATFPPSQTGPKRGSMMLSTEENYVLRLPYEEALESRGRGRGRVRELPSLRIDVSVGESTKHKTHQRINSNTDSFTSTSKSFKTLRDNFSHESLSKMPQRNPRQRRPASRDSLCDQIISDFSVIAPRDSNESKFANFSMRNPSIQQIDSQHILSRHQSDVSLSPIAAFPAYTGKACDSDLPYNPPTANTSSTRRSASVTRAHQKNQIPTPPDSSVTSSFPASDSDNPTIPTFSRPRIIKHKSVEITLSPSALEQMRFDRRAKRNHTLKEKASRTIELEKRLSRVERDNLILVRALTGIAGSVKGLEGFYPREESIEEEE